MNIEGFPREEKTNQSPEIIFSGNDKDTDVFNHRLDLKLEGYREKMEALNKNGGSFESNPEYLEAKYCLHIGNAVRFKGGAKYESVYNSLIAQDGQVEEKIFEKAWMIIDDFVQGGWKKEEGFWGFLKKENVEDLLIERIEVAVDKRGQLIWAEKYKDSSRKMIWHESGIAALKIDPFGGEPIRNNQGLDQLEVFLLSQYGLEKKIKFTNKVI